MKILKQTTLLKIDNSFLADILGQLINQYNIIQIFYTKAKSQSPSESPSHLVIHLRKGADAKQLKLNKWVEKARTMYNIHVSCIDTVRLEQQYSLVHPFIELYCQPDAVIYQNEESNIPLSTNRNWKKYRKKLSAFEERFFHDHDIRMGQIRILLPDGSSNSIFNLYERLMKFDLEYLEDLYSGIISSDLNLNERIHQVIKYEPKVQKLFVKKNNNEYFLTDIFKKAKETHVEVEPLYASEMFESVANAENGLYSLIELKFDAFRKAIKKRYSNRSQNLNLVFNNTEESKHEILDSAIERILTFAELEEIYLFHQTSYGENLTYYLLLVGSNVGTNKLQSMTQSLKSHLGERYQFVLISHDRYWIQKNLYQHQNFFCFIMQKCHLVYSSTGYHAELHWETDHNPYHANLSLHYQSTKDAAEQFIKIANDPDENFQGLPNFFSMFFLSFCRTHIFRKTFYLPNYLSSQVLWQLCQYADADLRKYDYLLGQFFKDIFNYMDYHMKVHHHLPKLDKDQVEQMGKIVEKLMNKLDELINKKNLLTDFHKNLIGGKGEGANSGEDPCEFF